MSFASPTSGIVGPIFLPISAVSISICIISRFCSSLEGATTARSLTRAPTIMSRSHWANALFA